MINTRKKPASASLKKKLAVASLKKKPFDKYFYYKASVQNPDEDVKFFAKIYRSIYKKSARVFREDFCGTFFIGMSWVKAHSQNKAIVVDIDKEPLNYGIEHHLNKLSPKDQKRIQIVNKSVLTPKLPSSDIISVSNFSYLVFQKRSMLLNYFKNARKQLNKEGLFFLDLFGGLNCYEPNEEVTDHKTFKYYWDQHSFDAITNHTTCYIHFKRKGEKRREKVFSYDWRLWTLPEIKDILEDAGFSKVHIYWEADSGELTKVTSTDEICETWIVYFVCQP